MDTVQEVIANYKIISRIGRGGMGAVFRARHQTLGREVALKLLPGEFTQSSEYVARFVREARAVANLNHPNVVGVHDAGEENGQYYIAMEIVNGAPLSAICKKFGAAPEGVVLDFLEQAAKGMSAAHKRELVHRDIKPENMLISTEGVLKIVDFGLVKDAGGEQSNLTRTGTFLGTPTFMSPEQCDGGVADARSDIYSLGASFYMLIAGQPPFSAPTALGILYKHKFEPPPDLKGFNPKISDEICRIINKMLNKEPEDRYQSCKELIKDIEKARENGPPIPDSWRLDDILEGVRAKEYVPTLLPTQNISAGNVLTMMATPGTPAPTGTPAVLTSTPSTPTTPFEVPSTVTPHPLVDPSITPAGQQAQFREKPKLTSGPKIGIAAGIAVIVGVAVFFGYRSMQQQKFVRYLQDTAELERQKEYEEALMTLRLALRDFPGNEDLQKRREALEEMKRALEEKRVRKEVKELSRADRFREKMDEGLELFKDGQGDLAAALRVFGEARKLEDDGHTAEKLTTQVQFRIHMKAGEELLQAGAFDKAIESFREARRFDTGDAADQKFNEVKLAQGQETIDRAVKAQDWTSALQEARKIQIFGYPRKDVRALENKVSQEKFKKEALDAYTNRKDYREAANNLRAAAEFADGELKKQLLDQADSYEVEGLLARAASAEKEEKLGLARTLLKSALEIKSTPDIQKKYEDLMARSMAGAEFSKVLKEAKAFMEQSNWEGAIRQLEMALVLNGKDQEAKALFSEARAREYERQGDEVAKASRWEDALRSYGEAITCAAPFDKLVAALKTKQENVKTQVKAVGTMEKNALEAVEARDWNEAKALYTRLLNMNPVQTRTYKEQLIQLDDQIECGEYFAQGDQKLKEALWVEAREAFKKAWNMHLMDDLVEQRLAKVTQGQEAQEFVEICMRGYPGKSWTTIVESGRKALELLPSDAQALRDEIQKRIDQVQITLKQIAELQASASVALESKRLPEARADYEKLKNLDPHSGRSYDEALEKIRTLQAAGSAKPDAVPAPQDETAPPKKAGGRRGVSVGEGDVGE